jgi:hypothetical protein
MKFNFHKKLVSLAVASAISGGAMMMAAPAAAMNVSQDGVGQVLLFPYYTVKNGYDTVFSVVNTSDKTAVFKIRWREALNSRVVRDFNVILSPYDVWNGAVTATTDGALIRTFDKSCTSPRLPGMVANADRTTVGSKGEVGFTNTLFSGIYKDGAAETMDRVKEGYFEVILMGVSDREVTATGNTLEYNAKHVNGVPRDCAKVDALFLDVATNLSYMDAPENILKGHVMYLNTANGTAIDAKPTHIEDFQTDTHIMYAPGDVYPDLRDGGTPSGLLFVNGLNNGSTVQLGPYVGASEDAVSDMLSATSVINEFATGGVASTSWVVTFPTKHHYTDSYNSTVGTVTSGTPTIPFTEWFAGTGSNNSNPSVAGKSCDNISMTMYNREEGTVVEVGDTQFSPRPPAGESVSLCYEANVIDFNASSVFGAGTNRLSLDTSAVGGAGWAELSFVEANQTIAGLPVIGFAAQVRTSGDLTTNYGSAIEHTYVRPLNY